MDGDEDMWSAEDILLAEEAIARADRLASSRAAESSSPAAVADEGSNQKRKGSRRKQQKLASPTSSIRTRSRARAGQQENGAAATGQEGAGAMCAPGSPAAAGEQEGAERALGSPSAVSRGAVEADPTAEVAAAITQLAVIPEVEELGAVLDRRRLRPYGFSVTDITAAEWCQQQLALALTARLPKVESEAMAGGKALHAALEAEVKVAVDVEVASREDAWAVKLLDSVACLRQLRKQGLTREVYVFGNIQGQWVKGVIDQLELDDAGRVRVVEHKTRRHAQLPAQAQQQTAALQVMLYRALLADLANACDGDNARELLAMHGLDGRAELCKSVKRHARQSGGSLATNLLQVLDALYAAAGRLPVCATRMQVRYLWQRDGSQLGTVDVDWDAGALQQRMAGHLAMLRGGAGPAKVPLAEEWKCGHCVFWHSCRGPSGSVVEQSRPDVADAVAEAAVEAVVEDVAEAQDCVA